MHRIDNRGVGLSDKPEGPYTTADMASDARAVMDHLDLEKGPYRGDFDGRRHSAGTYLQAPERVRSLVLVSTFSRLSAYQAMVFEHFKSVHRHCAPDDFTRCLQLWIWSESYYASNGDDLAIARRDAAMNPSPQPHYAFDAQCDACITHDAHARLNEIAVPTLVTVGSKDIFTPPALSNEIIAAIKGSELEVFEGSGHTHHWEQVERFNTVTRDFMLSH